jgi:SNF2 family DNA or RNA helicase
VSQVLPSVDHHEADIDAAAGQLGPAPAIFATGWNALLSRPARVQPAEVALEIETPRAVSLRMRPIGLKVSSFTFPEAPITYSPLAAGPAAPAAAHPHDSRKVTRIAPPSDIIKLDDRLYYLLQPPLESILASTEVRLPFDPFPYQYQGVAFLYPRFAAVLADEMGLGKTMQAILAIRLLLRSAELRAVLLVCPKPLVSNWRREFNVWAPEIPVCIIEGDQSRRYWQWRELNSPVKIANYEVLMRDREVVLASETHFDLVVLDEAQRIKNRSSTTSEICRAISRARSWALTGTPVENSTEDLIGIFDFLSPGYLHSGMTARRMARAAGDYILRRTKEMVLQDMPPKLFRDAEIDLSPEQWNTYKIAEEEGVIRLEHLGEELAIQHVFELVLRLKQICNFDPATGASSKLERLEADLEEVAASGQKAIVFSQWVKTLERLRERLRRFGVVEYHGRVPSGQRDQVLARFRDDPATHVILMSYGAGAVGLNLQFCRYVFLFDRWWNPAIEDQAINRAHRIGCTGSVTVTRMLTLGTIEERINHVLEEKRQLFATLIDHSDAPRHLGLTHDEIFGLFNLRIPQARPAEIQARC